MRVSFLTPSQLLSIHFCHARSSYYALLPVLFPFKILSLSIHPSQSLPHKFTPLILDCTVFFTNLSPSILLTCPYHLSTHYFAHLAKSDKKPALLLTPQFFTLSIPSTLFHTHTYTKNCIFVDVALCYPSTFACKCRQEIHVHFVLNF